MTLDPISIATEGYQCGTGPNDISIATHGYVCVDVIVAAVRRASRRVFLSFKHGIGYMRREA